MSFKDNRTSVIPPPPLFSYGNNGDATSSWSQFHRNDVFEKQSQFEPRQPPFKRARNSEEFQSSSPIPYWSSNSRVPLQNPQVNTGTSNIFFKTRMCAKFKLGLCRNGDSCNFAHGVEDMRQPPSNWQEIVGVREIDQSSVSNWNDDEKIIQKMKLCRKFYNGEECPYGDRCNFLHEEPAKFRDDCGRFRESSAINIGTTGTPLMNGSDSSSCFEPCRVVSSSASDALARTSFWKTKLCTKWEVTGHCPFGDNCHFAHGHSELQLSLGREGEVSDSSINVKPLVVDMEASSSLGVSVSTSALPEGPSKSSLPKWKGLKKINLIYGDWLDDLHLPTSSASKLEGE